MNITKLNSSAHHSMHISLDLDQHLPHHYLLTKLAYICIKQHCQQHTAIPMAKTVLTFWCFNKTNFKKTFPHLLSDGRRESKAKAESFLLSGWVILSMRSTHISIIFPKSWSIWKKTRRHLKYLKCYLLVDKYC